MVFDIAARMSVSLLAVLALAILGACEPTEPHTPGACQQTSEFGNYGCIDFAGVVTDSAGQAYEGVSVGPRPGADALQFNATYSSTQEDGRCAFRLVRFAAGTDSVSLYIGAAVIPTPPQTQVTVGATQLVRARVTPVGEVPDTVRVQFVLPRP